jgi:hypothetical protein
MNRQRTYLVAYGIAVGVRQVAKRGATTLAAIHAEMREDGVLDAAEDGHVWLLDVRRLGPFAVQADGTMGVFNGAEAGDYPFPTPVAVPA